LGFKDGKIESFQIIIEEQQQLEEQLEMVKGSP
jgi:hypothetical protein